MALVEHIAGRHVGVVEPAQRRLRHHEGMVGDDQPRVPGRAHVLLDKAGAEMRAGGVDALAAPVGQRADPAAPDQLGEPAREVAAHQVARGGGADPSRDQHERRNRGGGPAARCPCRLLVIQQAQKILAALAHDDVAALRRRVGIEPVELAGNLALQVAGVGRDPHRALVLLGPQAGRGDVAERLADPGAGLGEHRLRRVRPLARREGGGDRGGVIGLLRPRLGALAEQRGEPAAGILGRHWCVAGRRRGRPLLPFGEALPCPQPGGAARRPGLRCRQRRQHRRAPAPAGPPGQLGEGAGIRVAFRL